MKLLSMLNLKRIKDDILGMIPENDLCDNIEIKNKRRRSLSEVRLRKFKSYHADVKFIWSKWQKINFELIQPYDFVLMIKWQCSTIKRTRYMLRFMLNHE